MLMELKQNQNVKFMGIEHRSSKAGNAFQLVILADMDNVEKFEFFLRDDLKIDGLVNGDSVTATFNVSRRGFNTNIDLDKLEKVK